MNASLSIRDVEQKQRKTTFKITTIVVSLVLIAVGIVNIAQQNYIDGYVELILSLLFFGELLLINTKVSTDVLSNVLIYLTSGVLLRIISTSNTIEIGAFAGLLGLLIVAYFLFKSEASFVTYPIVITGIFIGLLLFNKIPLQTDETLKVLVVYLASAAAFYANRIVNRNKTRQLENSEDALEVSNTKLKQQSSRLLATSSRFRLATTSADIGVWEWDILENKLIWDKEMYRLYGAVKNIHKHPFDIWQKELHPQDAKMVEDAMQAAIHDEKEYDIVYRILLPSGEIRYIKANGIVEKDRENRPLKMIGVNRDITKEKILDQEKTEFVSLASHQLRTPLTAIGWYTELLLKDTHKRLNAEQKKYLQEVATGNRRMIELVSALLNISRLEMGTVMIEPKETNISPIIKSIQEELKHELTKKQQKLHIAIAKNVPIIYSDPNLVRIILQNLVTNAIKYTPAKGTIEITARYAEATQQFANHTIPAQSVVINVKDDGYGIPEKEKHKIFEKMYRATNIKSKNTEGTGLGLYMVKMLCNILQADIWFESREKVGSDFFVSLPVTSQLKKSGSKQLE